MCVCVSGKIQLNKERDYPSGGIFKYGVSFVFFTKHQNPELISLHCVINEIIKNNEHVPVKQTGIVLDTDLAKQDQFNNREIPYMGQHYLPPNITLIYAAADSCGSHLANKMIKICDRDCKKAFRSLPKEDTDGKNQLGNETFHTHKRIIWG